MKPIHNYPIYYYMNDRISLGGNEFQASMGSFYFTNRKLFNVYKEVLPNSMGLVESFIKEGKTEL